MKKIIVTVKESQGINRNSEPIHIPIKFIDYSQESLNVLVKDENNALVDHQLYCDEHNETMILVISSFEAYEEKQYTIEFQSPEYIENIKKNNVRKETNKSKSVVRRVDNGIWIDTGIYCIELSHGLADGTQNGKWGIKALTRKDEGINIIEENSFGGVYGPFFTQENAHEKYDQQLGVGAQHYRMTLSVIEDGPFLFRFKLRGTPPTACDINVRGKTVTCYFNFYYMSDWFERTYFVDDYKTTIWGESTSNMLTVGDETNYTKNGRTLFQDIMFFGQENSPVRYLEGIPPRYSKSTTGWLNMVDKTLWPYDINSLILKNIYDNYALLYHYSNNIHTFQIDNHESCDSGRFKDWVNVGTNGYCEIPYLPSGTQIINAYGKYKDVKKEIKKMENPLKITSIRKV